MTITKKSAYRIALITIIALGFYLALVFVVNAQQTGFVPLRKLDESKRFSNLYTDNNLTGYVNKMFLFMIALGAMLAVGRLAYAGWLYMMGDSFGNLKKAKEIVGNVVIGLLLLLSIYLILELINPEILNIKVLDTIKAGSVSSGGGTTGGSLTPNP